jgi:hypothetical protein
MSHQEIEPNQKLKVSEQSRVVQPKSTVEMQAAYGDKFQDHLMEQYKMCVEMADRISVRRSQANSFYISLLSALIALLSLVIDKQLFSGSKNILLLSTSVLGLALCFAWYTNIQSYRQLNSLKFRVIHEIEQYLPFHSFTREWEILKEQKENRKEYTRLTTIEKFVPLIFAIPYLGLLMYSFLSIFSIIK